MLRFNEPEKQTAVKLTWELADQVEAAPWGRCNPAPRYRSWHTNLMQADQGRPAVTSMQREHTEFEKIDSNLDQ